MTKNGITLTELYSPETFEHATLTQTLNTNMTAWITGIKKRFIQKGNHFLFQKEVLRISDPKIKEKQIGNKVALKEK